MLKELGKIFGDESRVKVLRFFLAHPEVQISFSDLSKKTKVKSDDLKKEIKNLLGINFLHKLNLIEQVKLKNKTKDFKQDGYQLNQNYVFVDSLSKLLLDFRFIDRKELLEDFKKFGKIKSLYLGGLFVQDEEGALDLLIAGDALDKDKIDLFIKKIEADFGTELRYAVFESEEFRYRVNMFDRLIKDFLKSPHEIILDKIPTRP